MVNIKLVAAGSAVGIRMAANCNRPAKSMAMAAKEAAHIYQY